MHNNPTYEIYLTLSMEQIKEGMDSSKSILVTYQKRVIHCYDDKFRIFYLMFDKLNLSLNKHFLQ